MLGVKGEAKHFHQKQEAETEVPQTPLRACSK